MVSRSEGKRVVRNADFGVVRNLFVVSVAGVLGSRLAGVGTDGSVPAPGMGGGCRCYLRFP